MSIYYQDIVNVSDAKLANLLRQEIDKTRGNDMDKLVAEALARLLERTPVFSSRAKSVA